MSGCSAEPQLHPPRESSWAFVRTRAKAKAKGGRGGDQQSRVRGYVPAPQARWKPHPRQSPPHPSCPGGLWRTSLLSGGQALGRGSVLVEEATPHPSRAQRRAEEVQWGCSEGGQSIPGLTSSRNFCTDPETPPCCLLPRGSVRSLTPAVHMDRSTPSLPSGPPCAQPPLPASSCSPPGPLCPCQTLHLSSHLWWEPLGKSPELAQSIMSS